MMQSEQFSKNSKKNIIIGCKYYNQLAGPLEKYGFSCIPLPDNPNIDFRLSGHTDLSVFFDGKSDIFLAPYLYSSAFCSNIETLNLKIHFSDYTQETEYPKDVALNVLKAGSYFFCNNRYADANIINHLLKNNMTQISVRQGYPACTALYLGRKSIITSDEGVFRAAESYGFNVLKIRPGYFQLPGFDYGFIGGCAFVLQPETIAFSGILDFHPDQERIIDFIERNGYKTVFLTKLPAFDIGGAVVLS